MTETAEAYPLTAEELLYLPDEECRTELVAGSLVREPLPGPDHGGAAGAVIGHLFAFVRGTGRGMVFSEMGFVLARDPDTVRGPDAGFLSAERLEAVEVQGGAFIEGAPDLAVEVLSPSNTERKMAAKAREYLAAGGRAVWVIDPRRETVTVHLPGRPPRRLERGDVLDGAPVLDGFRLPVAELFGG